MNVDMTSRYAITFCHTDGGTTIAVEKRERSAESFNDGLEAEYRARIDREAWGDNNTRGDNKVDIKVDNNARGDNKVDIKVDNKVDNNVWNDTVNDTVKHPQPRTRTTTPYNTRTSPVQHPYKNRRCRLGRVMGRVGFFYGPLNGSLSGPLNGPLSGLNETDSKLIGFIQSNPSMTIQELQSMLNLSRNGVRKALGRLKATGWLRRIGPDKGGHWEVLER